MRSIVAPVSADSGFMVMLPQSLYHISRWIESVGWTVKPDLSRIPPRVLRRWVRAPDGSPMMSVFAGRAFTSPGSGQDPPFEASAEALEKPPGYSVHRGEDDGAGADEGRDAPDGPGQGRSLYGKHDEVLDSQFAGVFRGFDGQGFDGTTIGKAKALSPQGRERRAPRDARYKASRPGEAKTYGAAYGAYTYDTRFHGFPVSFRAGYTG